MSFNTVKDQKYNLHVNYLRISNKCNRYKSHLSYNFNCRKPKENVESIYTPHLYMTHNFSVYYARFKGLKFSTTKIMCQPNKIRFD